MDLIQVLTLLVIVGICAAIAQFLFEMLLGHVPGNLLTTVIIGILGAYLGNLIPSPGPFATLTVTVGTGETAVTFNWLWTILGSMFVLFLLYILPGGKRGRRNTVGGP